MTTNKEITEQMRIWIKDSEDHNYLVQQALKKYSKDTWDAIHWTDNVNEYKLSERERADYIEKMKIAWDKQEPFEKRYRKLAVKVVDELEYE